MECTSLGMAYLTGAGAPRDAIYAMELFKKGCETGDPAGCVYRADAYRHGQGVKRNTKRAIDLYLKACTTEFLGQACRSLGEIYILGDGVERDAVFSSLYYGQGCAAGDGRSCVGEALGIERGDFTAPDPAHARKQLARACELLHGRGCTLLGERYMRGTDGPKDMGAAATMFRSGCSLQEAVSCRWYGRLANKGKGVTKDPVAAKQAFIDGCTFQDPEACVDLADVLKKNNLPGAAKAAARACDMGFDGGCVKQRQMEWKLQMESLRSR